MSVIDTERICQNCGTVVAARETLSPFDTFVLHTVEVVWCPKCGTELPTPGTKP